MPTVRDRNSAGLRMLMANLGRKNNAHDALLESLPLVSERKARVEGELFAQRDNLKRFKRIR